MGGFERPLVVSPLVSGRFSTQEKSRVSWSSLSRLPPTFWRYLYSVLSSWKTSREDQADLLSAHPPKVFSPPNKSIRPTQQKYFSRKLSVLHWGSLAEYLLLDT